MSRLDQEHAAALNTKGAPPSAKAPDELVVVATLHGGGAAGGIWEQRPETCCAEEQAVPTRVQSRAEPTAASRSGAATPPTATSTRRRACLTSATDVLRPRRARGVRVRMCVRVWADLACRVDVGFT